MSVYTDPYQHSYPPLLFATPVLNSIAPGTAVMGVSTSIQLNGTGFHPGTIGAVGGVDKPTTYISSTVIRIQYTGPSASTVQVTARNGSKVSAQKAFVITATARSTTEPKGRAKS